MISAPDRDPFAFSCKDSLSHRNKANGCSVVKKPCNAIIQRCYSGTAAVVMFAGCWLAGGGLGSGRMAYLGPNALFTALATFVLTYVGGLACDQLRRLRNWWSSRRALRSVDLREQSNDILDVGRHIG